MRNLYKKFLNYWSIASLLTLFFIPTIFAQSSFTLSWESEVGCLEYDDRPTKSKDLSEMIANNECIFVCEESTVIFNVEYGTQPVTSISWEVDGGLILSTSNNDAMASIEWPSVYTHGSVTATITLSNGQEFDESVCVTVRPKPQGGFEILGQQSEYFCSETELFFNNLVTVADGSQIVSTIWNFGDGTLSSDFNTSHTYIIPGQYEILLTVYDECGCSNIFKEYIIITEPGISISCPTLVCEGALETYFVTGPSTVGGELYCNNFNWSVDGGQILNQSDNSIDVLWDNVGSDGFGYVYFDQSSCDVQCDNILVAEVPVVTIEGTISGGKIELCQNEQSRYALPRWPTTDVEWQVVNANNTQGGPIPDATVLLDQRNEVAVDANVLPPGDYILQANYTNTLLKCGGEAEFLFSVLQNLEIDADQLVDEICQGNTADFFLTQTINGVSWSFSLGGQVVAVINGSGTNSQASFQFVQPGYYTVSATANGYCTDYAEINIVGIPDVSAATILGSDAVCPGLGEVYTFDGDTEGFDVEWFVDHGSFLGPNFGESVTIVFDAGFTNYEVSAQLVDPNFSNCESELVLLAVERFEPNAQIVQTTGNPIAICSSSEESFSLQGYPGMDNYEWTITPAELATVSAGEGTENVNILFNEPYQGQTQGTISVSAKVCGVMEVIHQVPFTINQLPDVTIISSPAVICPQTSFSISFSIIGLGVLPLSYLNVAFEGVSNAQIPTPISTGGGTYEYNGIILPNINPYDPINVSYSITASGPGLCAEVQAFGSLQLSPAPNIQVSRTDGDQVFCTTADINTELTANLQGTGVQQNNIYWVYMGNQVGQGPVLDIGNLPNPGFGFYTAQATNSFGCITLTKFEVEQDCFTGIPACTNQSVTVTSSWISCDKISLTANYTGNPTDVAFFRDPGFTLANTDPLPPTNNGNTLVQEFETDASGTYLLQFKADYGTCELLSDPIDVKVEYKALLNIDVQCLPGAYEVLILNQSTRIPSSNPNVAYTFEENPGGQIITPIYSNANEAMANVGNGEYTLSVTLTSPGKPTCEVTTAIELQLPDAAFTILENPICAETPVVLQPDNPTLDATYLWEFQLASNTLENISPTLASTSSAGEIIQFTVTDPYGCTDMATETIIVNEADFDINIVSAPLSSICEGQSTDLSFQFVPGSPTSTNAFQWYLDQMPLSMATNSTLNGVNEAGEYSLHLFDAQGCLDATASSIFINEIQAPYLSAEITASVCLEDDITLSGTLTPATAEYQISRSVNGAAFTTLVSWTAGPVVSYIDPAPAVGDYSYKVEYRDLQTTCTSESIFNATVHPLPTVAIQLDNVSCNPYTVQMTATGNQPGTYTWSNGMSGTTITVDHGGAYRVRFQPEGADCEAIANFTAPKSPDEFTWIFPTGCFEFCQSHYPPVIIGPMPPFSGGYAYDMNNSPISSGTGIVPALPLVGVLQGALDLSLDNGYCSTTTDLLHIDEMEDCQPCTQVQVRPEKFIPVDDGTGFIYYEVTDGVLFNPYGITVTITLSSPDGTFSPAAFTLPPVSGIQFAQNPIDFIPFNPIVSGITILYEVSGNPGAGTTILCEESYYINIVSFGPESGLAADGNNSENLVIDAETALEIYDTEMKVAPNPAVNVATVYYTVENQQNFESSIIKMYSLNGKMVQSRKVNGTKGQTRFNLNGLASGTYVVVFFNEGQRMAQQVIIKE